MKYMKKTKDMKNKILIVILALLMVFTTSVAFAQAETSGSGGVKKSISKAVVVLSERQVKATGDKVNPVIKSVTLGKTVIPKSAYTVKYYTKGGNEVDNIVKAGRYSIVIKAKKSSKYKGEVSCPYTVLGLQQKIVVEKTKINLALNYANTFAGENQHPDYILKPSSNGDATGFGFKSYDKSIVKVNKNGEIFAVGKGSTKIKINTKGNVIFHPSRIYVYVEVE